MLDWRILAFTVPSLFVIYQSLAKLLPKGTSIYLVNAYAALIGLIVMLGLHFLTQSHKTVTLPTKSLMLSLGIGTLISLGNFGIIKAYALGAPQSSFTLFFYVTLIIYGIIFGLFFWHEKIQLMQLLGIMLSISGMIIFFHFKK